MQLYIKYVMAKRLFFVFIVMILGAVNVCGQAPEGIWRVSLLGGTSWFYGDVNAKDYTPESGEWGKIGVLGAVSVDLNHYFGLRLEGSRGQLYGSKNNIKHYLPCSAACDTVWFEATVEDFVGLFVINLTDLVFYDKQETRSKIEAYAGAGLLRLTTAKYDNDDKLVKSYGYAASTDGVNPGKKGFIYETVFPIGIIYQYKLTKTRRYNRGGGFFDNLYFEAEASIRFAQSDKLDAEINSRYWKNDKYTYLMGGLTYRFPAVRRHRY